MSHLQWKFDCPHAPREMKISSFEHLLGKIILYVIMAHPPLQICCHHSSHITMLIPFLPTHSRKDTWIWPYREASIIRNRIRSTRNTNVWRLTSFSKLPCPLFCWIPSPLGKMIKSYVSHIQPCAHVILAALSCLYMSPWFPGIDICSYVYANINLGSSAWGRVIIVVFFSGA